MDFMSGPGASVTVTYEKAGKKGKKAAKFNQT